jgi:iron complex outermembrane receptor protein
VNLPAWGPLSASVTYLHDKADGDIKNLGAGTVWHYGPATGGLFGDRVSPKTLGGHKTDAVAAAVALRPGAEIKAVYRFNYTHQRFVPDGAGPGTFDTTLGFLFQPLWAAQDPATRSPLTFRRPKAVNNWYTTPGLLTNQTHSLTVTAPISSAISIKSLTAFRKMSVNTTNQLDGLGGIFVAPNTPLLAIVNATQSHQKSFQQEVQANIDTKWLRSTVGLLHYNGKVTEGAFPGTINAPFGSGFGFAPAYADFTAPSVPTLDSRLTTKSDAAYTQNELHIFQGLDLVGGGRVTKDRRDGIDNSTVPSSAGTTVRYRKTTWTYLVGLNYKLNENVFTYVKYSTAYISGGQLANHKFDPATAKSAEAGIKADLLGHRLRANLALFTVKYGQFQILTNPRAGCNFPGVPLDAPQCIVNGGDARDRGFELELTYLPVQGLTLEGSTAYNDMHFTRVDPNLRSADGSFVTPQSPKWTASAAATYNGPTMDGFGGGHLIGRAEVLYTSSAFAQAQSLAVVLQETKIPSKAIVNGRIGVGGFHVGPTEVEVAAYAKNLFNNKSLAFAADLAADVGATWERARAFGVDVKVSF